MRKLESGKWTRPSDQGCPRSVMNGRDGPHESALNWNERGRSRASLTGCSLQPADQDSQAAWPAPSWTWRRLEGGELDPIERHRSVSSFRGLQWAAVRQWSARAIREELAEAAVGCRLIAGGARPCACKWRQQEACLSLLDSQPKQQEQQQPKQQQQQPQPQRQQQLYASRVYKICLRRAAA